MFLDQIWYDSLLYWSVNTHDGVVYAVWKEPLCQVLDANPVFASQVSVPHTLIQILPGMHSVPAKGLQMVIDGKICGQTCILFKYISGIG